jgi:hypothetical protein
MTKRLRNRLLIMTGMGIVLLAAVSYEYIIPTVIAHNYIAKVYKGLQTVDGVLKQVAGSTGLSQFNDPDVPLTKRIEQTGSVFATITKARATLATFKANTDALPQLPGAGWFGDYQVAKVKREQSQEVIDEYARILAFIAGYTPLQRNLDDKLATIEQVNDFDDLAGQGDEMAATAAAIRADADILRNLAVSPDLKALQQEALVTFSQAAAGFDDLATGLYNAVGSEIDDAATEIAAASLNNKTTDRALLVSLIDKSPTFVRLYELPEKVDYVER